MRSIAGKRTQIYKRLAFIAILVRYAWNLILHNCQNLGFNYLHYCTCYFMYEKIRGEHERWLRLNVESNSVGDCFNAKPYPTTPPIPVFLFNPILAKPNGTWQCQAILRERHRDPTSFFFSSFSLLNNPCKRTSGRPVFEYAGYYENGEHDNHERFPDVRTMSSPRSWTGANGNKTGPERHYRHREYRPLSISAAMILSTRCLL